MLSEIVDEEDYPGDKIAEADLIDYLEELSKMHPTEFIMTERYGVSSALYYGKALRAGGLTPVYFLTHNHIHVTVEEQLTIH